VLAEIDAAAIPQLLVWNKIDASGLAPGGERDEYGRICRVFVSARSGAGLADLRGAIAAFAMARTSRTPSPETISL
jgi:GTP-binding protein HflX